MHISPKKTNHVGSQFSSSTTTILTAKPRPSTADFIHPTTMPSPASHGCPRPICLLPLQPTMRAPTMSWPTSRSLFRPYRPPPPPPLAAGALVPATGSGSVRPLPLPLQSLQMTLKRPRGGGEEGSRCRSGDRNVVKCSVREDVPYGQDAFRENAVHPGRGWKGAHPPPAFSADEEFSDIRSMAAAARQIDRREEEEGRGGDCGGGGLPDLNESPPPESQHSETNSS